MNHAVESIARHRAHLDQTSPMRKERAEFAHLQRRHPHFGNQIRGQQSCQMQHVAVVGLDAGTRDHLDETRMGDDGASGVRDDLVEEGPGIGGGFEDDGVGGVELLRVPQRPLAQVQPTRRQDHLLLCIDPAHDDVVLVNVEGEVTFKRAR